MPILPRNFVFEFAGVPKSGKTTVMDVVSHYLRRRSISVEEYHGGGRYAPIGKDALPQLNLYLAAQCLARLSSIGQPTGSPTKIYLLDRGPIDRVIFSTPSSNWGDYRPNMSSQWRPPSLRPSFTVLTMPSCS